MKSVGNILLFLMMMVAGTSFAGVKVIGNGGDLTVPQVVQKYELQYYIDKELPMLVQLFFNNADPIDVSRPCYFNGAQSLHIAQMSLQVCNKLFRSASTIFDILPKLKYVLQDQPCKDPQTGADKDASLSGDIVCFSADRLIPKLNVDNYKKNLLALSAHEASHYLGTDENEAQFIEGSVQTVIIMTTGYRITTIINDIRNESYKIKSFINLIGSNSFSHIKTCILVNDIATSINSINAIVTNLKDHGFSHVNSKIFNEYVAILIKSGNAETFCNSLLAPTEIDVGNLYNFIFKAGETEISVTEYIKRLPGGGNFPNLKNTLGSVKRVSDGNKIFLIEELNDLSLRIDKLYNIN